MTGRHKTHHALCLLLLPGLLCLLMTDRHKTHHSLCLLLLPELLCFLMNHSKKTHDPLCLLLLPGLLYLLMNHSYKTHNPLCLLLHLVFSHLPLESYYYKRHLTLYSLNWMAIQTIVPSAAALKRHCFQCAQHLLHLS